MECIICISCINIWRCSFLSFLNFKFQKTPNVTTWEVLQREKDPTQAVQLSSELFLFLTKIQQLTTKNVTIHLQDEIGEIEESSRRDKTWSDRTTCERWNWRYSSIMLYLNNLTMYMNGYTKLCLNHSLQNNKYNEFNFIITSIDLIF